MTIVTLVHGGSGAAREAAIAALAMPDENAVAIIEGLAGAGAPDEGKASANGVEIIRIAPGCPCCTGKLAMRVILNRTLRKNPDRIYLGLAHHDHLAGVIDFLREDQYRERLKIGQPVDCSVAGTGFANTGY